VRSTGSNYRYAAWACCVGAPIIGLIAFVIYLATTTGAAPLADFIGLIKVTSALAVAFDWE
jgi:hypothetical protein